MRRFFNRLSISRILILFFLVFLMGNSAWANPIILEPSLQSKGIVLIFLFWLAFGFVQFHFTRKSWHWPVILLLILLILFLFEMAVQFTPLLWSFYITWSLLFLFVLPFQGNLREKRWEMIRHGSSLSIILSLGIYLAIRENIFSSRLYESFKSITPAFYYVISLPALGFSLYPLNKYSKIKDLTKSKQIKFLCVILIGSITLPFLYSKLITPGFEQRPGIFRIKADQRSLATGLEVYFLDHNSYPNYVVSGTHSAYRIFPKYKTVFDRIPSFEMKDGRSLHSLTTPVAYITGLFGDPFSVKGAPFAYYCVNDPNGASGWIVWSPGPDGIYDMDIDAVKKYYDPKITQPSAELLSFSTYDPTNGYYSRGDVYRVKQ